MWCINSNVAMSLIYLIFMDDSMHGLAHRVLEALLYLNTSTEFYVASGKFPWTIHHLLTYLVTFVWHMCIIINVASCTNGVFSLIVTSSSIWWHTILLGLLATAASTEISYACSTVNSFIQISLKIDMRIPWDKVTTPCEFGPF